MRHSLLVILMMVTATAEASVWTVTGSKVTFAVRNAGAVVEGRLGGLEADIRFDPAAPGAGSIRASVGTTTVKTGIALRDRHLRSCDYFCAGQHPKIVMESHGFEPAGEGRYRGIFDVTIRGTKKRVEVPFTFRSDGDTGHFAGDMTIDRTHFGVGGKSMFVASAVAVHVEVDVKREGQ